METPLLPPQRPAGAGQDDPADGSGQRAADDLGADQRQGQRRPALGCSREDLRAWLRAAGEDVHALGSPE